jgi:hypothetical protein
LEVFSGYVGFTGLVDVNPEGLGVEELGNGSCPFLNDRFRTDNNIRLVVERAILGYAFFESHIFISYMRK